jgi:hemerythrin superfamily protein
MTNPIDQVISKGAGIAHQVKAQIDGLGGVWNTLAEQHAEAMSLLKRAKADPRRMSDLWPTIRAALQAHEQAELLEVYPVLARHTELRAMADRHEKEATALSQTIDQMDAQPLASARFEELLHQLITLVKAHAEEEEQQIFPLAQAVIGDTRSSEIDKSFQATAAQLKARFLGKAH